MTSVIATFDLVLWALRRIVLAAVVVFALVAFVDWLVRTRRISPFSRVARFFRTSISPVMAPVERRVLRAGGLPSNAPWWTLVVVAVGGIVVLSLLGFVRDQLTSVAFATQGGIGSIARLLVSWLFAILQIAIFVRVIASLVRVSPYSPWVRWSYVLSEPILRPLRQVIPPIGMIDISPIAAYFLLWLLQSLVLGLMRGW